MRRGLPAIPPLAALLLLGAGWSAGLPLMRVAVSTGYQPLGLIVWQNLLMAALCPPLLFLLGEPLPRWRGDLRLFLAVAVFGIALPGYFSFLTAAYLPAGVRAIILAIVPMFTLPMALALGAERPDPRRALGVLLGAAAMALIAFPGLGEGGGGGTLAAGMVLLAMLSPLSYAVEANYLASRPAAGPHPLQILFGAAILANLLCAPLALLTGQSLRPAGWGAPEQALAAAALLNVGAYAGYVWLAGRAGAVFASQIGYVITIFGVAWSMLLLGERYGASVWIAFVLVLIGVALIQPRPVVARNG